MSLALSAGVAYACLASPDSQAESVAGIWGALDALHFDKLGHAGMAFMLAFGYWHSFIVLRAPTPGRGTAAILTAGICSLLYCCSFEVVQQWLPLRAGTWADVVANTLGVLLFVGLARFGVLTPIRV